MIFSIFKSSISFFDFGVQFPLIEMGQSIRFPEPYNTSLLNPGSGPGSAISQYGVGSGSTIFLLPFIGSIVTANEEAARKQRRIITTSTDIAPIRMFMNRYIETPKEIRNFLPLLFVFYRKADICQPKICLSICRSADLLLAVQSACLVEIVYSYIDIIIISSAAWIYPNDDRLGRASGDRQPLLNKIEESTGQQLSLSGLRRAGRSGRSRLSLAASGYEREYSSDEQDQHPRMEYCSPHQHDRQNNEHPSKKQRILRQPVFKHFLHCCDCYENKAKACNDCRDFNEPERREVQEVESGDEHENPDYERSEMIFHGAITPQYGGHANVKASEASAAPANVLTTPGEAIAPPIKSLAINAASRTLFFHLSHHPCSSG
jgi:hypothetical protein